MTILKGLFINDHDLWFENYGILRNILKNKFNLVKGGSKRYEYIINDQKYSFKFIRDDDEGVITVFNQKDKQITCAIIQIEKDIMNLQSLYGWVGCIYPDTDKIGSKLLQGIIDYGKKKNIKEIQLKDNSKYTCQNKKYNYTLCYGSLLVDGLSWFSKFGFVYIDDITKERANNNRKIMKKTILTEEIYNKIIIKLEYNLNEKSIYNDIVKELLYNIYLTNKNKNIKDFFKEIRNKSCILFANMIDICMDILGLQRYMNYAMILKL
jgi:hypothetical protein